MSAPHSTIDSGGTGITLGHIMVDMRHVQRLINSVLTTAAGPANMSLAEYCHKHFIVITVVLRNKNTNIRIEINAVEGARKYQPYTHRLLVRCNPHHIMTMRSSLYADDRAVAYHKKNHCQYKKYSLLMINLLVHLQT